MSDNKVYKPLEILNAGVTGVCLGDWRESLDEYRMKRKGYSGLKTVLEKHQPAEVIQIVKDSGLRGRGGAGFPAGVKWGFIPPKGDKAHY